MVQNLIQEKLLQFINNRNYFFVFPTQTAADLWADRIISISDTTAVAMERFVAWDTFKGSSIKSKHQDKTAIPSIMRQMFTDQLITQNESEKFLQDLIVPEYSESASGFTDWIASILPGLQTWKKYFEKNQLNPDAKEPDKQDKDLLLIYDRYSAFLEENKLFDPAWETPPFEADGNHYVIFFPEILSDYSEYEEILKSSEDISVVNMPQESEMSNSEKPSAAFFENTRQELNGLAMKLLELHNEKNIPWEQIAINVPDLDTDGAYIDRELSLYQIPHVLRYAKPLTSSGAGAFFNQLKDCVSNNFDYESIKNLILNTELPWIKPKLNSELIKFGQENNCICSFVHEGSLIDIWEKSFDSTFASEDLMNYYKSLNKLVTKIVKAKTFSDIREGYFSFRNKFFDMDNCPPETDLIISRCITELGELINVHNDFPECEIKSPYSFFTSYLNSTNYLKQTTDLGVQILPYKMAATAPFDCHIIIDSSQAALSVIYKPLSFLRDDKRKILFGAKDDPNVTENFLKLYQMNSISHPAIFSVSGKNFTGYSQLSSYLKQDSGLKAEYDKLSAKYNSYAKENEWFLGSDADDNSSFPNKIFQMQQKGFNFWAECQKTENSKNDSANSKLIEDKTYQAIKNRIENKRFTEGNLDTSSSTLKNFYNCPRMWLIDSVAKLQQQNNEAELMDVFTLGSLYHKIMEFFLSYIKSSKQTLALDSTSTKAALSEDYETKLDECIDSAIEQEKISFLAKQQLYTMKKSIYSVMKTFLISFCKTFEGFQVAQVETNIDYVDKEKNILFTGRIDCLLQEPGTGDYTLVDFKKSKGAIPGNIFLSEDSDSLLETESDSENESEIIPLEEQELPDFQMPMYLYILKNNKDNPIEVDNCGFYSIVEPTFKPVAGTFDFGNFKNFKSMEDYEVEVNKTLECINHFAKRISDCDFSINENLQTFSTCNSCDYRALCRRVFNVSRKK